jgi:predicted DNA binding CopG/RHH family protein
MTKDEKVLINLRIRKSLVEAMKDASARMDIPYAQFIRMAIKKFLDEINIRSDKFNG